MKNAPQLVQRRRYPRRKAEAAVAVRSVVSPSQVWRGHCVNFSDGGAGVIVGGPLMPGQVVDVEFAPAEGPATQLAARVAHRNHLYCGLEFLGKTQGVVSELMTVLAS